MQDRQLPEDIEVVDASGLTQDDFIEIDLGDAVQVPADGEQPAIKCTADAFKFCMNQTVLSSLSAAYPPPESYAKGVMRGLFYEADQFSWKKTAINAASLGLGGAASMFAIKPAEKAVIYMTRIITQLATGTAADYFVGQEAVVVMAQVMNMSRSILLITLFTNGVFKTFLIKTPEAEKYLRVETPVAPGTIRIPKSLLKKFADMAKIGGRKTFDLISAIVSNLPVLLTIWGSSPAIALTAFVATLPLGFVGMGGLQLTPEHKYKPQTLEANYMRQQLCTFMMLPRAAQNAILDKLKTLQDSNHPNKEKVIYGMLLNLCKPDSMEEMELIRIMKEDPETAAAKINKYLFAGWGAASQIPFAEASGVDVARLFANPTSPEAIALGVLSVLVSLLPTIGFGWRGGKRAGTQMFVKHPTLGQIVNPELRAFLKSFIMCLNAFAGGILTSFTYEAAQDFANLINLQAEAAAILEAACIGTAYIGSQAALGQFCLDAIDEIVLFLAQHSSSEDTRRLMNFVNGYTQLIKLVETMNAENYVDLTANWKLAGKSELSKTLHALMSQELNDNEYVNLQMRLTAAFDLAHGYQNSGTAVLEDRLTQDQYLVSESFLDHHQGLRRRRPAVNDVNDDIEMQFNNGLKL